MGAFLVILLILLYRMICYFFFSLKAFVKMSETIHTKIKAGDLEVNNEVSMPKTYLCKIIHILLITSISKRLLE